MHFSFTRIAGKSAYYVRIFDRWGHQLGFKIRDKHADFANDPPGAIEHTVERFINQLYAAPISSTNSIVPVYLTFAPFGLNYSTLWSCHLIGQALLATSKIPYTEIQLLFWTNPPRPSSRSEWPCQSYETLAANKQRSERSQHTRARNKKAKASQVHSDAESVGFGFASAALETNDNGRDPSRTPTPIATANEPEAQSTRSNLQEKLTRKFNHVLENSGTQTLMEVDDAISADPAYASQPEEQGLEARFLSPVLVGAGGGFHLDHPTHHWPGNGRTYRGSKGGPRTIARPDSPVPTESTQLDDHSDPPHIQPFSTSEQDAPSLPIDPTHGLGSPIFVARTGLFLGYPDDQGSHRSASPVSPDKNPVLSQPLSAGSLTPSLTRELLSDGSSRRHRPLRHEGSDTHISTSSKSLGGPIPTPPLTANREEEQLRSAPNLATSTPAQSRSKRPLKTPATPLPPRKRPAMTFGSTNAGKTWTTRLNITEINSQRVLAREVSRHQTAPSQTRRKGKSATRARTDTPAPTTRPQRTGNDNLDLLDGSDEGDFVADLATKGVAVENRGCRKPTVQDLSGHERAFYRDTLEMTWAFSMGEGNFQTRAVFATWVSACYSKLVELKLPDLDTTAMAMSDDLMTVILNNLCNARYQDYTRLCEPVRSYYQLKNPSTLEERQDMKDKVGEVYPGYFHYGDMDELVDPYEGEILFVGLRSIFFWGPTAIGAKYPALFRSGGDDSKDLKEERKHLAVLAYVATMIQFCLGEWSKGYFKKGTLNATMQQSVWVCHFDGLKNVNLVARKRLIKTYNEWVQKAYDASQAQTKFSKKHYVQAVVRQKDVRPDTPSRSPSPLDNH
ncbi:hypothetical protein RSOL_140100, partial [Rhizoctonia solani AG-3 Rhs1AP]